MKKGDYVLAMKWPDGDPGDPWAVGFYSHCSELTGRHIVVNGQGETFRAGGYRRVEKISHARGAWLLENSEAIERSGRRLGYWLRYPMSKEKPRT